MNIPNINNTANAGDGVGRNREVSSRERADLTARTGRAPEASPEAREIEQTTVRPLRDEVMVSRDQEFIGELVEEAVNSDVPPRQEVVDRASRRVQENYYSSREFMGNLATKLINTDTV